MSPARGAKNPAVSKAAAKKKGAANKPSGKQEYLVINIGSGIQVGSSVAVVGVTESISAAKEVIRRMGASGGKIVIAEKRALITRTPVVELKESDETIIAKQG